MASQKTITKKIRDGDYDMITHGILVGGGVFDKLVHEINENSKFDTKRKYKKIAWEETKVFDNSNRGRRNN